MCTLVAENEGWREKSGAIYIHEAKRIPWASTLPRSSFFLKRGSGRRALLWGSGTMMQALRTL